LTYHAENSFCHSDAGINMVKSLVLSAMSMALLITGSVNTAAGADEASRKASQPLSSELRERCLTILQTGLASDEFWPAMHAAEAMTLAGAGRDVVASLSARLPQEKDDQRRCGLARELIRAGERDYLPLLFQILADEQSNGRTHAAESLYKLGETGDGQLLRAAMSQTTIIPLQIMAAGAMAKAGDPMAMELLRKQLRAEDKTARNLSAWILGRHGNASDVEVIQTAMTSETDEMSLTFLTVSLACLNEHKGRIALMQHLNAENNAARTMAAEFAGISRTVEAREKLIQLLDDPFADVRIRSAQSLIALSLPEGKR
jgi:sialidase-1